MTVSLLSSAFLAGLVGSPHCVGMCGGFAAAAASGESALGRFTYHLGRWMTYATLGALVGALGLRRLTARTLWARRALAAVLCWRRGCGP